MPVTNYIYFGDQLLAEADEDNNITRRYTNEPDEYTHPIGHTDVATGESSYYHYDGQGNTRAVTDENENVTDTFTFDSWGDLLSRTGMTNVPFQFGGEYGYYKDEELDTYYVMERIYDPSIIRWLSVDPLQFESSYLYVINNPLRYFDLAGLLPVFFDDDVEDKEARDRICKQLKAQKIRLFTELHGLLEWLILGTGSGGRRRTGFSCGSSRSCGSRGRPISRPGSDY